MDYMNTEEGLKVVGFRYSVARLEDVAEFFDGSLRRRCDGEVVNMETKVDAFTVGIKTIEQTGIVHGA